MSISFLVLFSPPICAGYLCGACADGTAVTALLNRCQVCPPASSAAVAFLGTFYQFLCVCVNFRALWGWGWGHCIILRYLSPYVLADIMGDVVSISPFVLIGITGACAFSCVNVSKLCFGWYVFQGYIASACVFCDTPS